MYPYLFMHMQKYSANLSYDILNSVLTINSLFLTYLLKKYQYLIKAYNHYEAYQKSIIFRNCYINWMTKVSFYKKLKQ